MEKSTLSGGNTLADILMTVPTPTQLPPTFAVPDSEEEEDLESDVDSELDGLTGDVKDDFNNTLEGIVAPGSFATFGSLSAAHMVNPDIHLLEAEGASPIGCTSLTGSDARRIIQAAHQAPFGKGSETIVDTNVRKTWELNHDQFSLSPEWQNYVNTITKRACYELGVSGDAVTAELYKMLLYEKGAMFKPHTDSEKTPGMFATLVISLPSHHSGGGVVLSHEGHNLSFQTKQHEYLAWYSDVVHQVTEVKTGYRWVLTYNLVNRQPGIVNTAAIAEGIDTKLLRRIFRDWREQECNDRLIYILDHQYTDASININTLKTTDFARAQRLLAASTEHGFSIYLASLERVIEGGADDDGYDEYDRYGYGYGYEDEDEDEDEDDEDGYGYGRKASGSNHHTIEDIISDEISLTRVVDIHGNEVTRNVSIEEEDIVQPEPFEDREPDEDAYEGFTGNEGATATHWYRDTVIVMVPNEKIAGFFLKPYYSTVSNYGATSKDTADTSVLTLLRHLLKRDRECPKEDRARYRMSIRRTCQHIAKLNSKREQTGYYSYTNSYTNQRTFLDATIGEAVKACAAIFDIEPLPLLVSAVKDSLPLDAVESLKALVPRIGFERLKPTFDEIVNRFTTLSGRYCALQSLVGTDAVGLTEENAVSSPIDNWASQNLTNVLLSIDTVSNDDAAVIIDIVVKQQSSSFFENGAVALAKKHIKNTTFIIMFLCKLYERRETLGVPTEEVLSAHKELLELMLPHVRLRKSETPQQTPTISTYGGRYAPHRPQQPKEPPREPPIDGVFLASLMEQCLVLDLGEITKRLTVTVTAEVCLVDARDFPGMILPFLKTTLEVITKFGGAKPNDYRTLYQTCLEQFVLRYVELEPVQINWARNPVGCHCNDCAGLNRFLRSPIDRVGRFPMGKQRRQHLHSQLDRSSDCTHTTERKGNPQTLIVTKTGMSYEEKLRNWKKRFSYASKSLGDLDANLLFKDLLAEKYSEIMNFDAVRMMVPAPRPQLQANASRTGRPPSKASASGPRAGSANVQRPNPPQIAGRKRKAVVIDLTVDDSD